MQHTSHGQSAVHTRVDYCRLHCREELLRDNLWAKADRDMSGPVGNQKQDQAQGSGQATRTSTGTGTYSLLVDSAMWERHAHEAESHGNTIGHSPRHVPSFSLSLSLSLSESLSLSLSPSVPLLTSVPQPRLFFVVFASVRIHLLYIYIPHPKSTDALCWYCAVLYCMKHEA